MADYMLYRYVLKLLSPTVIVTRAGARGIVYTAGPPYIPGSQVRGALLAYMLSEGHADRRRLHEEALEPKHAVTPALPCEGAKDSLYKEAELAHALCYTYKLRADGERAEVRCINPKEVIEDGRISADSLQAMFVRQEASELRSSTPWRRLPEREPYHGPVVVRGGKMFRADVEKDVYVEVGLELSRGGAKPGALYAYEYIVPGQHFTGYITCAQGSLLCELLGKLSGRGALVRVGKGIGRGFGLAKLLAERVKPERGEELREGEYTVLKVVGLTFVISPEGSQLARPPRQGDRLSAKAWLAREKRSLVMEVTEVLGSVATYMGWSYRTGSPKLPVSALQPGSLIVARVIESQGMLASDLKYTGLDCFASQGFNILEVVGNG